MSNGDLDVAWTEIRKNASDINRLKIVDAKTEGTLKQLTKDHAMMEETLSNNHTAVMAQLDEISTKHAVDDGRQQQKRKGENEVRWGIGVIVTLLLGIVGLIVATGGSV